MSPQYPMHTEMQARQSLVELILDHVQGKIDDAIFRAVWTQLMARWPQIHDKPARQAHRARQPRRKSAAGQTLRN